MYIYYYKNYKPIFLCKKIMQEYENNKLEYLFRIVVHYHYKVPSQA